MSCRYLKTWKIRKNQGNLKTSWNYNVAPMPPFQNENFIITSKKLLKRRRPTPPAAVPCPSRNLNSASNTPFAHECIPKIPKELHVPPCDAPIAFTPDALHL